MKLPDRGEEKRERWRQTERERGTKGQRDEENRNVSQI
jgi:hypothetical protein